MNDPGLQQPGWFTGLIGIGRLLWAGTIVPLLCLAGYFAYTAGDPTLRLLCWSAVAGMLSAAGAARRAQAMLLIAGAVNAAATIGLAHVCLWLLGELLTCRGCPFS